MKIEHYRVKAGQLPDRDWSTASLVLLFADAVFFTDRPFLDALDACCPGVPLAGCSTAGEIMAAEVSSHEAVLTRVVFENASSRAQVVSTPLREMADSFNAGTRLAEVLPREELAGVLLLGTGVTVNGTALVNGLASRLPAGVNVFGGLAADNGQFVRTLTLANGMASDDTVVAIGLYGETLATSYGSFGGWEPFGPLRKVSRCEQNVLYELDGESALAIYRRYLGEYAADLPASGLLFPFEMQSGREDGQRVIRTILGIDEENGALLLAGEVDPEGFLRLMHASTEHLITGAGKAATMAITGMPACKGERLALLVSCVGRRLVMGDRVEEEVEEVADILGANTRCSGFYSNGEISPGTGQGGSLLCNQTMTITLLGEVAGR